MPAMTKLGWTSLQDTLSVEILGSLGRRAAADNDG